MSDSINDKIVHRLAVAYRADRRRVAEICDTDLDRSGALLGWLRHVANATDDASQENIIRRDAPELVALVEALRIAADDIEEWVRCKSSLEAAGFNLDDTGERANKARAALAAYEALK